MMTMNHAEYQRHWRLTHPELVKEYRRRRKVNHREYMLEWSRKRRRKNGQREYSRSGQLERRVVRNARRIKHNGRWFIIDKMKVGVCNWCRAVRGIDCKHTQWHHDDAKYDEQDISRNIIELCPRCHAKESGLGHTIVFRGTRQGGGED